MKIGELAKATGTQTETIRYYEREGLLPPPARGDNNYRHYDAAHAERLTLIRQARLLGGHIGFEAGADTLDAAARAETERLIADPFGFDRARRSRRCSPRGRSRRRSSRAPRRRGRWPRCAGR